jgi:prophage regulatory protein
MSLPEVGYVRLPQILAVIPISRASWWAGVKSGKYPAGVLLGPRTRAWSVESIRALMASFS